MADPSISSVSFTSIHQALESLSSCLITDRFRLKKAIQQLGVKSLPTEALLAHPEWLSLCTKIDRSKQKVEYRKTLVPEIEYDEKLPVAVKKSELVELIKNNQVVVIAGETGSGKTTQIPKICLEAGLGVHGRIGCTQPRRLAARSVAERIAEELGSSLGQLVGYQVRFLDQVHQDSLIKVMTDGILLAEVQNDRFLNKYEAIIIDEAHERSVNIDFLLGILKQLLPKRPDLKVIVTSATIDTQRFAKHFEMNGKKPPVVEVSGRTYPVEVRYRPLASYEDDAGNQVEQDRVDAIISAIDELALEDPFGDVLVFQVGERDIKETAEALRKHQMKNTDVVALYARLSMAEQQRVFQTAQNRRIILSTNVAETSLTVPGIKFVIDPGQVRISRYSVRNKVQRLPIEKISQASANQRKGRCGRVSDGICIRLYDEEDFRARPEFTDPEIHRTALSSVILTMTQLRLGDVKKFPFIEAPEDKSINDGFRQLHELGAIDDKRRITNEGKQIAKLPIDPSVAKMVIEGEKNGVLAELIIIAAVLSIQDPRDINETTMQAARTAHKQFEDGRSDFLFFLNLWRFYEHQRRHLSQNKLRKLCKTNFLSYLRMREWHDLTKQLEHSLKDIGMKVGELHLYEEVSKTLQNGQKGEVTERLSDLHSIALHRSLMAGLLGNISTRGDEKSYLGARNTKLFIHPSSSLFKRKPKWMLSAELVETSKLFARTNASIDVRWVESLAKHLIKHSYADPHWQKKAGQVGAYESLTLYGLPIVTKRPCNYGPINPTESRKIFLRHGLAEGQLDTKAEFFVHNQALIEKILKLESKLRRPDILVDDEVLYDFYAERIPSDIYSKPAFEKWVKQTQKTAPKTRQDLFLTEKNLMRQQTDDAFLLDYPDQVSIRNQISLDVDYHFEPGKPKDGLIYHIPLANLNNLESEYFEWLTPALLKEKTTFYIKSLPKALRKQFIPAPQYAELVLGEMGQHRLAPSGKVERFENQLVWALNRRANDKVSSSDFANLDLPSHLTPYFILEDDKGKTLAENTELHQLKSDYQHLVDAKIHRHQKKKSHPNRVVTQWDFGDLALSKTIKAQGREMLAYPALQLTEDKIVLSLMGEAESAKQAHAEAVIRLIESLLQDKLKYLQKKLPMQKACLCYAPYGTCQALTQQVIDRALSQIIPHPEAIRKQNDFEAALETVRSNWVEVAQKIAQRVNDILVNHQKIAKQVRGKANPRWLASLTDIKGQLDDLISTDFVRKTPEKWFHQMPRYLKALDQRLQKIDQDPSKDQKGIAEMRPLLQQFQQLAEEPVYQNSPQLVEIRWMLEELRISLFSQPMKTIMPVSIKRIEQRFKAM